MRDRPGFEGRGPAAVPDEIVQAEDREVAVVLIERHRGVHLGGLLLGAAPAAVAPLEDEQLQGAAMSM
jgi:hypothetical protein